MWQTDQQLAWDHSTGHATQTISTDSTVTTNAQLQHMTEPPAAVHVLLQGLASRSSSSSTGTVTPRTFTEDGMEQVRHTACTSDLQLHVWLPTRKRQLGMHSPHSSPSNSPMRKVQRRARTRKKIAIAYPLKIDTCLCHPPPHNLSEKSKSLKNFKVSPSEEAALKHLREEIYTYMLQKHTTTNDSSEPFLNLKDYL